MLLLRIAIVVEEGKKNNVWRENILKKGAVHGIFGLGNFYRKHVPEQARVI